MATTAISFKGISVQICVSLREVNALLIISVISFNLSGPRTVSIAPTPAKTRLIIIKGR